MPEATLVHRAEFCAAFRLARADRSEEWNRATYGACFSPNYHGHNYLLEVSVSGPIDAESGMVMDLQKLAALVREHLVKPVDHRNLNEDVDFLAGVIPTTENLALRFWERLDPLLPAPVRLREIRIRESRDNEVWVREETTG